MSLDAAEIRAIAEEVADVLDERGLVTAEIAVSGLLSAVEVGVRLGKSADWVYDNKVALGAIRFGSGRRARLGFEPAAVDAFKRERQVSAPPAPKPRRPSRRRRTTVVDLIPYDKP